MTEIAAGDIPDLMYVEDLPVRQYGAMGLLEDLWPYIENDPDLGRENIMDHVFECAEQDGKLYMVFDSFLINSVCGAKSVVGDRTGWTLEDLSAALATMPEGCSIFSPDCTKTEILKNIIYSDLDSYIDWESGTCSFNTEEFKDVLSFCNEMETEEGNYTDRYILISEGREMLIDGGLRNFMNMQREEALFGEPVSYIGYPQRDGSCGSSFSAGNAIVITTACKNKDDAWSFLRQLLLPQNTDFDVSNCMFPTNRQSFEKLQEQSAQFGRTIKHGESIYDSQGTRIFEVMYKAMTQEQFDQVMELYNAIDTMYTKDNGLWEIVSEQAQAYFAGDKSLAETVELIQSRAELYVNERL